jgi:hypothetical protein
MWDVEWDLKFVRGQRKWYRYDGIFQDQGAGGEPKHMLSNAENQMESHLPNGERSAKDTGDRERVNGERNGGDRPRKVEKTSQKDIIRSHIGRRSYTLRDRTQNDVGVPPGTGTKHRRRSKCAYGRAQTAVVVLGAGAKAKTTTMTRRLNELSIVLSEMKPAKLRPV